MVTNRKRHLPVVLLLSLGGMIFLGHQAFAEAVDKADFEQPKKQTEQRDSYSEERNTLKAKRMTDRELDTIVAGVNGVPIFPNIGIGPKVGIGINNGFVGFRGSNTRIID